MTKKLELTFMILGLVIFIVGLWGKIFLSDKSQQYLCKGKPADILVCAFWIFDEVDND